MCGRTDSFSFLWLMLLLHSHNWLALCRWDPAESKKTVTNQRFTCYPLLHVPVYSSSRTSFGWRMPLGKRGRFLNTGLRATLPTSNPAELGWKPRFSDLNPCLFFFFFADIMRSNQFIAMIKYSMTQLFLFSTLHLKNWNCSSATEMEQKSTSITISTGETCRIGLLWDCVLSLAIREFNWIHMWEQPRIQAKGRGGHGNEPCWKGTRIAGGEGDEDKSNTHSLSNHSHRLLWLLYIAV